MIVKCEDVKKYFSAGRGYAGQRNSVVKAVDGVSLKIEKGAAFGLVGESGSGKTTLGRLILGSLKPDSGRIEVNTDRLNVIFQDPHNSLDPKMKVFDIMAEGLVLTGMKRSLIKDRVGQIVEMVKLPPDSLNKYPHQFSGGQRQRIAIGRAVLTNPEFIVCDEPVSSLDITVQLQILELLKDIRKKLAMTYLFISHDLRVIRFISDRVAVMRHGRIIEEGPASEIYSNPKESYTKTLLDSVPEISIKAK